MKLLELQRRMAADLMQPLTKSDHVAPKTAAGYIKPNDRLTSRERLEIYSRSYWYRILDSLWEDFPGLRAILGQRAFDRLARAYLADCPSRSYTMRDLGSGLENWLRRNPKYAGNRLALAVDMVRVEWAHIEAWDSKAEKVLGPEDLLELGPKLRIGLQPYIRLLELHYPVDDLRIRVNRESDEHEVASNAGTKHKRRMTNAVSRLKPQHIFLAVHRVDFSVYYRRLTAEGFRLLESLRQGGTIESALVACCKRSSIPVDELQPQIELWFAAWAELGWFCSPTKTGARS
jgi:hypothetical protein